MVEKTVEITGSSTTSIEEAVRIAVARAGVTLSAIHTAHVEDISAMVVDNNLVRWKVKVKITFTIHDQLHE
ncbi:MAG TPA: dodecin family protein [Candidatus Binataceae bacterium]